MLNNIPKFLSLLILFVGYKLMGLFTLMFSSAQTQGFTTGSLLVLAVTLLLASAILSTGIVAFQPHLKRALSHG